MRRNKKAHLPNLEGLLSEYSARPAKYSNEQIDARRAEFETAYAMNRLEGAGKISETESLIANLWITGRITDQEYFELCDFDVEQRNPQVTGAMPH